MPDLSQTPLWLVYGIAIVGVGTLLSAIYMLRRGRRSRGAGLSMLSVSMSLHAILIFGLPTLRGLGLDGIDWGSPTRQASSGSDVAEPADAVEVSLSMLETMDWSVDSEEEPDQPLPMGPLPITQIDQWTETPVEHANLGSEVGDASEAGDADDAPSVDPSLGLRSFDRRWTCRRFRFRRRGRIVRRGIDAALDGGVVGSATAGGRSAGSVAR